MTPGIRHMPQLFGRVAARVKRDQLKREGHRGARVAYFGRDGYAVRTDAGVVREDGTIGPLEEK